MLRILQRLRFLRYSQVRRTKIRLLQALEDSGPNSPDHIAQDFIGEAILAYGWHEVALPLALSEATPYAELLVLLNAPSQAFDLHWTGVAVQTRTLMLLVSRETVIGVTEEVSTFLGRQVFANG